MTEWELLVFVNCPRPYVVEAMPRDFHWTYAEKTNPNWRIIRVPLVEIEVMALKVPKPRPIGGIEFEARERTISPWLMMGLPRDRVTDIPRKKFLASVQ